jgi:hypothetical protein
LSGAEVAFSKVPDNIRKFGIGGGYMSCRKRVDNKVDFIAGRDHEYSHVHFFEDNDKLCMQLTNELKRDTPEEYRRIDVDAFLKLLADMTRKVLDALESMNLDDSRYARKKVVLTTLPRIHLSEIKRKKAFFVLLTEPRECRFGEIDMNIPQIGVVKGCFGKELALIFVGKGKIYALSVKKLEQISSELEHEFESRWNLAIGAC